MKTYTNKSNAKRAALAAHGGNLNGFTLHGTEGAWYYAQEMQDAKGHVVEVVPVTASERRTPPAVSLSASLGTPTASKAKKSAPAKKAAPAKPAPAAKASAKKAAKKVAAKKAAPARKPAKVAEEYDVKNGPTQGRISGYHIDTDRDEKHGVKRRSAGTIGGRLWAIFDKLAAKAGGPEKVEIAVVKESPLVADFNDNKIVIEFYYWRRYNGVRGRGRKQKVAK
jgi:uncharacterized membrane protein YkoI